MRGHYSVKEILKHIKIWQSITQKELNEAMKDPEFAKSAFRYEMDNHEYSINWDGDSDVLNCFGWTPESFAKVDISIQNAYLFARNEHIEHFRNLGVV